MSAGCSIGTSTAASIAWMISKLRELAPASILDVGCGWGRWGFLAREFLEIWEHRFDPSEWRTEIVGLDVHAGTWTPIHDYVYDLRITADVRSFRAGREFDAVVACDVIEHMTHAEGLAVLEELNRIGRHLLLGLPVGAGWLRPGHFGNPHEAHLAEWSTAQVLDEFWVEGYLETTTEDGLAYLLAHIT